MFCESVDPLQRRLSRNHYQSTHRAQHFIGITCANLYKNYNQGCSKQQSIRFFELALRSVPVKCYFPVTCRMFEKYYMSTKNVFSKHKSIWQSPFVYMSKLKSYPRAIMWLIRPALEYLPSSRILSESEENVLLWKLTRSSRILSEFEENVLLWKLFHEL